jgi:predicted transcriptional regulator
MTTRGRQQGELEQAILDVLWFARDSKEPKLTSQQVLERLPDEHRLALTTVLTVLSRLGDKGLVIREQGQGRSLLFWSSTSREEHDAASLLRVFETSNNPALAFSHFASKLSPQDLDVLKQSLNYLDK